MPLRHQLDLRPPDVGDAGDWVPCILLEQEGRRPKVIFWSGPSSQ